MVKSKQPTDLQKALSLALETASEKLNISTEEVEKQVVQYLSRALEPTDGSHFVITNSNELHSVIEAKKAINEIQKSIAKK